MDKEKHQQYLPLFNSIPEMVLTTEKPADIEEWMTLLQNEVKALAWWMLYFMGKEDAGIIPEDRFQDIFLSLKRSTKEGIEQ